MNIEELAKQEVIESTEFFLLQSKCSCCDDWSYQLSDDGDLLLHTSKSFQNFQKIEPDQNIRYIHYPVSNLKNVLAIIDKLKSNNIAFMTSYQLPFVAPAKFL